MSSIGMVTRGGRALNVADATQRQCRSLHVDTVAVRPLHSRPFVRRGRDLPLGRPSSIRAGLHASCTNYWPDGRD